MLISVITINYNNSNGLNKTIESVVSQSYKEIEYIIIDGGSSDDSPKIIRKYYSYFSYWVSEKDNGVYDAMNKGIEKSTGDYIVFLNSGDSFLNSETVNKAISLMGFQQNVDIFYGNIIVISSKKPFLRTFPAKLDLSFFKNSTINHQASFIRASLFKEFGLYPEHFRLASDFWLFLLCIIRDKKFNYLNISLVKYDAEGLSSNDNYKDYKIEKKLIWESLIPKYCDDILIENESLKLQLEYYINLSRYKLVRLSIAVNERIQNLKKS